MANEMRDYLEQRERDLEARIAGLETMLCDGQAEITELKTVLRSLLDAHDRGQAVPPHHMRLARLHAGE